MSSGPFAILEVVPTKNLIRVGLTHDKMSSINQAHWLCCELDRRFRSTTPMEHTNAVFRSRIQEEWPLFKQRHVRIDGGVLWFAKILNGLQLGYFGSVDKFVAAKAPDFNTFLQASTSQPQTLQQQSLGINKNL
jgi:hypothetical protein